MPLSENRGQTHNMFSLINRYRSEIMGVAAVWILFFHEWDCMIDLDLLGTAERFVVGMGFYGVEIFLLLSGMGLVFSIQKHSVWEFYKRRYIRVLIPFAITITICGILRKWDFVYYLQALVGYHFWTKTIYTVQWFTFVIMMLYLFFPGYYYLLQKSQKPLLVTVAVLILWLWGAVSASNVIREDLYGFINRIPIFLTGVWLGEYSRKKELVFTWKHWIICITLLAVGVVLHYLTRYRHVYLVVPGSVCFLPSYIVSLTLTCCLVQVFSVWERNRRIFWRVAHRILAFFGGMSMELFCVQDIVLGGIRKLLPNWPSEFLTNVVNLFLITLCAYCLQWVCKRLYKLLKYY